MTWNIKNNCPMYMDYHKKLSEMMKKKYKKIMKIGKKQNNI